MKKEFTMPEVEFIVNDPLLTKNDNGKPPSWANAWGHSPKVPGTPGNNGKDPKK